MKRIRHMTYNELLNEIGYLEAQKEALENKIYDLNVELKRRYIYLKERK